ncbi:hypothetical protein GCM10023187_30550 [Nibrella viscosa]|uniref:DinB-like domain-containing protein n=1 Tax=Nibrella viscosa TaxID=1084524 RepID=A0ABP8KJB4_9BACT
MKYVDSQRLLHELKHEVDELIQTVEAEFAPLTNDQLLQAPAAGHWSIAQCFEHLNTYGYYYLPLMEQAIRQGETRQLTATRTFRSSWLGDYFTRAMLPKPDGSIGYKAKAFKNHRPEPQLDAQAVLAEFLRQQHHLIQLLQQAQAVDMGRLKIPISIARWIKLSLGDTFRFFVAHEIRHVLQAQKARQAIAANAPWLVER